MTPSDESQFTERHYIDSLSVQDSIVPDSVLMTSTSFKNLEKLEWDLLADPSIQRYKLVNSDWVQADTMLYFSDTFDVSAYWSVVDTPFIDEGLLFVDSSEWFDTNYVFLADDQIRFISNFEFEKKQLSADSLVFRINTDCNDNGEWDAGENPLVDYNEDGEYEALYEYEDNNNNGEYDAGDNLIEDYNNDGKYQVLYEYTDQNNNGVYDEGTDIIIADYNADGIYGVVYEFEDRGNGLWDPAEVWYDINVDDQYDLNEPYEDRNCNEKWDGSESFTDANANNTYDDGEEFVDTGNRLYDATEGFTLKDIDGDGVGDMAVGLKNSDVTGTDRGGVLLVYLNSNGSAKEC